MARTSRSAGADEERTGQVPDLSGQPAFDMSALMDAVRDEFVAPQELLDPAAR